jgi:hypothetical protein
VPGIVWVFCDEMQALAAELAAGPVTTRQRLRYIAKEAARHDEAARIVLRHVDDVAARTRAVESQLTELYFRGRPNQPHPAPRKPHAATTARHPQV